MEFDLDACIAALPPWRFTFGYEGRSWPTRRPTLGMMIEIAKAIDGGHFPTIAQKIGEIFYPDCRPPVEKWPIEALLDGLRSYMFWFKMTAQAGRSDGRPSPDALAN
jgi:hypothetical protein